MPISDRQPRLSTAAAALLACGLFITTASARHSDIPDLPPAPPSTAALAVTAMQAEVTAFQTTAAALLIDPSPQPPLVSAAAASGQVDLIATAALNNLARSRAQPWEFAAVLSARDSAHDQLASAITLHLAVDHTAPMRRSFVHYRTRR